jgi:hypothetical protein
MEDFSGKLAMVDPKQVVVDHRYQRPEKASLIAAIASDPRWELFGSIVLFQRSEGERYYAADGQQRLRGVLASGNPPDKVPAVIFTVSKVADEAAIFVRINEFRKQLTPLEKHEGKKCAKEPAALSVERAVGVAGFSVSDSDSSRAIGAPSSLYYALNALGEQGLTQLLVVLHNAWPDDKKAISAAAIKTLADVIEEKTHNGGFSRSDLERKLAKTTPGALFRKAEEIHFDTGKPKGASLRAAFKELAKV